MNDIVALGQQHSINYTGVQIVVDGDYGPETKENGIRCLQKAMNTDYNANLDIDGIFGSASSNAISGHYVEQGETQEMVRAVQIGLMLKGYNCDPDGIFGHNTWVAVVDFQRDNGLETDGIVGTDTFSKLFDITIQSGGGSSEDQGDWRNIDPNNLANFGPDEFKCQCGCGIDVCDELKQRAQALRNRIGLPMVITDGYRCEYWNQHEGGTSDSLHKQGMAFDFQVNGQPMSLEQMYQYRDYCHECGLTCGIYPISGFMHCQIGRGDWIEDE